MTDLQQLITTEIVGSFTGPNSNAGKVIKSKRPMFPHVVDSTMLAAFRSCPQKMYRSYVEHWKAQVESVHLVAGGSFAKGIEVGRKAYFEGSAVTPSITYDADGNRHCAWTENACTKGDRSAAEALGIAAVIAAYGDFDPPPASAKSLERTAGALEFYFEQYPFGNDGMEPITMADGRRGIEFSFAEPLDITHPLSGDPIIYAGRSDLIAHFADGIYIVDEKTASSLGPSWSNQWEMRAQFTGYQWAAGQAGIRTAGSIVRGISILKTKYDTQQAITYRSPYEIARWKQQTERDIARMIQCWREGYWDWALDGACTEYGGCSFVRVCKSEDPEVWLPMQFEQRVWNPLARKQETVAEWEASWEVK